MNFVATQYVKWRIEILNRYTLGMKHYKLFQNFQSLLYLQSREPFRDYPRFFGIHSMTVFLLCNLSVVTFLARVITFLCSLLDDHFVTFLAMRYYISMQLFYYISMQVLLHFYAGITFLCKVITFLCRLLHFQLLLHFYALHGHFIKYNSFKEYLQNILVD